MYQQRQRRIEDRIISMAQPHVRPIMRGKAGTPAEFGAVFFAVVLSQAVFRFNRWQWHDSQFALAAA